MEGLSLKNVDVEKQFQIWNENISVLRKKQNFRVYDIMHNESYAELKLDKKYENVSLIITPIFVENSMWGAIAVSINHADNKFEKINERIMHTITNFLSIAIINEQKNIALWKADNERQLIFDNIHIPLWLHDGTGKLIQNNSAVCDTLKIPHQKLTTEYNHELISHAFPNKAIQPLETTLATAKSVVCNIHLDKEDYTLFSDPIFNEAGKISYVVKSAINMTKYNKVLLEQSSLRKALEILLKETDIKLAIPKAMQVLRDHLGGARVVLVQFNIEKRTLTSIIESVKPGEKTFEFLKNIKDVPFEAKPNWADRFIHEECIMVENLQTASADVCGKYWNSLVKDKNMTSFYANRIIINGRVWGFLGILFEDKFVALDKDSLAFMGAFTDFTKAILERDLIKTKLRQTLNIAEKASKAKGYFLASISHEIRTPLNAIIGFSELLSNGVTDPAVIKEYVESISYSGNLLLQLINDVLDLSKLEADKMVLNKKPVDMADLGNKMVEVFKYIALKKDIKLILDIPAIPSLMLDVLRIRQILLNLVGNAVKFTEKGSVLLRIQSMPEGDGFVDLTISIIDTGVGISAADIHKLTQPFVQLSHMRGTNSENNGTGLGLSIVKRMLAIMDGELVIESVPGEGSCFKACLHHVKIVEKPESDPMSEKKAMKDDENILESLDVKNFSILIVDDVQMNLKILRALLGKIGIQNVVSAASGSEALEQLKIHKFDAVLTDMWMPEMSGEQLVKEIRLDKKNENLPVFALTADIEVHDNFQMKLFADILLKPLTMDKLKKMIQKVKLLRH